jgi:hypothetical protein
MLTRLGIESQLTFLLLHFVHFYPMIQGDFSLGYLLGCFLGCRRVLASFSTYLYGQRF